jgi:hypothetical protein
MRAISAAAGLVFVLAASYAQAQNPPAAPGPGNPAVRTDSQNNPGAPVAGASSFTEGQAKSRIESHGYSNVTGLTKDGDGVWRGKGMKDGQSVDVSLDFQGNVVAR